MALGVVRLRPLGRLAVMTAYETADGTTKYIGFLHVSSVSFPKTMVAPRVVDLTPTNSILRVSSVSFVFVTQNSRLV